MVLVFIVTCLFPLPKTFIKRLLELMLLLKESTLQNVTACREKSLERSITQPLQRLKLKREQIPAVKLLVYLTEPGLL